VTSESGLFDAAAAFTNSTTNLTGVGDPQRLEGADVTWGFFSALGVAAERGRVFGEVDRTGTGQLVVISDGVWRRYFGGGEDVVGSTVHFDGVAYTIVGVAAPDVTFPGRPDFWRPLLLTAANFSDAQRGAQYLGVVGKLKAGITLKQADSAIALVAENLARRYPLVNKDRVMSATPLHDRLVRGIRPALLVLLGAVIVVLAISCVNVANLQLARAYARSREVAIRAALGAGRGRLVRQFLVESLVVGIAGGAAGFLIADVLTHALIAAGPPSIPRLNEIGIDARVVAFAVAAALATSVAFGLVPAVAATGASPARAIASAGRGTVGPAGASARKSLVVGEMALAVVLVVAAALLVRSYARLSGVDPGFSPNGLLTFSVGLPEAKYKTATAVETLVTSYVARLAGAPGVESAAAAAGLPLEGENDISSSFTRNGEADTADSPSAAMRIVTPDYFRTLRIPLRAGRLFSPADDDRSPEVVIINEEMARRFWPGQNPIGQQLHLGVRLVSGVRSGQKTIVGIVGNAKYGGLDLTSPPEVYLPYAQHPIDTVTIAVRTTGEPLLFGPTARALLATLDRELPLARVRTMDQIVGQSIAERRFTMMLLAAFAAIAVVLAGVGVYGVLAYLVSRRTQEIGVRMAVGATASDVVSMFLREAATLAFVGLGAGILGALAAARALTTLLFGVTASDPATFVGVSCALAVAAFGASYLPARRAAKIDPIQALRNE